MNSKAWLYRYPIPKIYRNVIASIFELIMTNQEYYQLVDMLLSGLSASEVSLVAHLLGITNEFLYADKYLNPLREQDPFMIYFEPLIREGFRVLILGDGILGLMERIQLPAAYWSRRIAEVETRGGTVSPPEVWNVAVIADGLHHRNAAHMEISEEPSDIMVQDMDKKMHRFTDTIMPLLWLNGTGVISRFRCPRPETQQSKYICTVGSFSFDINWDDLYKNVGPHSILPYIDASQEPNTMRLSENDTTMEFRSDIGNKSCSLVLWKRRHSLKPNYIFTGRALDHYGRDVFDEMALAFRFPSPQMCKP